MQLNVKNEGSISNALPQAIFALTNQSPVKILHAIISHNMNEIGDK